MQPEPAALPHLSSLSARPDRSALSVSLKFELHRDLQTFLLFPNRTQNATNISKEYLDELATKTVELFKNIINATQKYKILGGLGNGIYDELQKLRLYRNKVQTDVDIKEALRKEDKAFSKEIVAWALSFAVRVIAATQ